MSQKVLKISPRCPQDVIERIIEKMKGLSENSKSWWDLVHIIVHHDVKATNKQ